MTAKAIRENAASEWHLERDGKAECGQAMPSNRFEVSDVAHLWGKENNFCSLCCVLAEAKDSGDVTIAELTRLAFQPVRRLILEELRKHIRSNTEERPVEQISNKDFDSRIAPLSPFLKDK